MGNEMELEIYKAIYRAHKTVFDEIIKLCPHKPTAELLKAQIKTDSKLINS